MTNEYTLDIKGSYVKIFINGILHICFKQQDYLGLQSWKEGLNWYNIEIYTKNKDILLAYDDVEKWTSILKLIEEKL